MYIHAYEKRMSICAPPNSAPPPGIESSLAQAKTRPGPAVRGKFCGANEERKVYHPEPKLKTPRREPQPRAQATLGQPRKRGARKTKKRKKDSNGKDNATQRTSLLLCHTAILTPTPTRFLLCRGTCHAARWASVYVRGRDNMYVWNASKAKAGEKATRNARTDGRQNRCERQRNAANKNKNRKCVWIPFQEQNATLQASPHMIVNPSGTRFKCENPRKQTQNPKPQTNANQGKTPSRTTAQLQAYAQDPGEGNEATQERKDKTRHAPPRYSAYTAVWTPDLVLRTDRTLRRRAAANIEHTKEKKENEEEGGGREEGYDLAAPHRTAYRAADQAGDEAPYDYKKGNQVIVRNGAKQTYGTEPRVPAAFSLSVSLPTPAPPTLDALVALAALALRGLGAGLSPVGAANVVPDGLVPLVEVEAGGDRSELELVVRALDAAVDADVERGEVERRAMLDAPADTKDPAECDVDSVDLEVDREVLSKTP
ncbi:hypothetical protein C8R45DRAFT_946440 [Mycena sanguinolenta]|nr:hypothetical protein C8R45DRAFT_946440 [Mycena sanguinolenta]